MVPASRRQRQVDLPRAVRGATAIRLLGDQVDEAAALNDTTTDALVDLLLSDRTAWLDPEGAVFFKDEPALAPAKDPVEASAPLDQTFQLHSKPGAQRTIYLDFDGGSASGTQWHGTYPTVPVTQPAWDPNNTPGFDTNELTSIQTVWASVAEDYAAFDVDVTTADPGRPAIYRSSAGDQVFGSHVLITPSAAARRHLRSSAVASPTSASSTSWNSAGGDGYGYMQPAWVFPQSSATRPKNIAEAVATRSGTTSASQPRRQRTRATTPATARGRRSWASATTTRSASGARATTPAPTTRRTTSPSSVG